MYSVYGFTPGMSNFWETSDWKKHRCTQKYLNDVLYYFLYESIKLRQSVENEIPYIIIFLHRRYFYIKALKIDKNGGENTLNKHFDYNKT
jgi:hypothetical protein